MLVRGEAVSPGAVVGEVVLAAGEARKRKEAGESAVLIVDSLDPEDREGMLTVAAVVTASDGLASHDLVALRGMGVPVVTGCEGLEVEGEGGEVRSGEKAIQAGAAVTVDGSGGEVLLGEVPVLGPEIGEGLEELLGWADEVRALGVRANADTAEDAGRARAFGAEGIGLCRTERMIVKGGRSGTLRRVILAQSEDEEKEALEELEEGQREDFEALFRAMSGLPVAVRLLDPPLHEFLPSSRDLRERLAKGEAGEAGQEESRRTLKAVEALEETNPMLGTRGVRLGLLRPEIYRTQARALAGAARNVRKEGFDPVIEILVPLVQFPEELKRIKELLREELGNEDIPIGPTVEAPRACFVADSLAREAPFLSFGTNDLTQTTLGISRDDAKDGLLPRYLEENVLARDPFERVDEEGVGRMIEMARDLGRGANPDLELGVCGEHGGNPESIRFFHEAGFDYVSCSPYRVLVARLAAAQATLRG